MNDARRSAHGDHHVALLHGVGIAQLYLGQLLGLVVRERRQLDAHYRHVGHGVPLFYLSRHDCAVLKYYFNGIRRLNGLLRRENQSFRLGLGDQHPRVLPGGLDGIVKPVHLVLDGMDRHNALSHLRGHRPQAGVHSV